MTVEGAGQSGIGLDRSVEGGQKGLEVHGRQGNRLIRLHDFLGTSQGVGQHKVGHAGLGVGGRLVEQLPRTEVAADELAQRRPKR